MDIFFAPMILARLLLGIVALAFVLRFVTLAVTGNPATWVSAIVAAVLVPVFTMFAFPTIADFAMQIAAALQSGIVLFIGMFALLVVLSAILYNLILRVEGKGESPGFGPCLIIAVVSSVALRVVDYVIGVVM